MKGYAGGYSNSAFILVLFILLVLLISCVGY